MAPADDRDDEVPPERRAAPEPLLLLAALEAPTGDIEQVLAETAAGRTKGHG
jgi:hypothetical protein